MLGFAAAFDDSKYPNWSAVETATRCRHPMGSD
jgi:hypothetical protein